MSIYRISIVVCLVSCFLQCLSQTAETVNNKAELAQQIQIAMANAQAGDAQAQYQVGNFYLHGQIPGKIQTPDYKEAARWYLKSALGGCEDGMVAHAGCLINGYLEQNPEEAIRWYEKAAEKGKVSAYYNLGVCYDKGIGVSLDAVKAYENFQKAAQMGSLFAANSLGICYYLGKGTTINKFEAFRLFKLSGEKGNSAAFANVGRCYLYGEGTDINPEEGIKWYEKAAKKGEASCQFFLGHLFYHGDSEYNEGVVINVDYDKAVSYLSLSIENPKSPDFIKAEACRILSACYRFGRGVKCNEDMADDLIKRAASLGDKDAVKVMQWLSAIER